MFRWFRPELLFSVIESKRMEYVDEERVWIEDEMNAKRKLNEYKLQDEIDKQL